VRELWDWKDGRCRAGGLFYAERVVWVVMVVWMWYLKSVGGRVVGGRAGDGVLMSLGRGRELVRLVGGQRSRMMRQL
jgi:hypothetical protein